MTTAHCEGCASARAELEVCAREAKGLGEQVKWLAGERDATRGQVAALREALKCEYCYPAAMWHDCASCLEVLEHAKANPDRYTSDFVTNFRPCQRCRALANTAEAAAKHDEEQRAKGAEDALLALERQPLHAWTRQALNKHDTALTEPLRAENARLLDGMETAWGVIANAHGGDWLLASPEWREAAERWRDHHWHAALRRRGALATHAPTGEGDYEEHECGSCGDVGACWSDGLVWTCRDCAPKPTGEAVDNYPCADCGAPRTKAQGGTVFTACDACWDKTHGGGRGRR